MFGTELQMRTAALPSQPVYLVLSREFIWDFSLPLFPPQGYGFDYSYILVSTLPMTTLLENSLDCHLIEKKKHYICILLLLLEFYSALATRNLKNYRWGFMYK